MNCIKTTFVLSCLFFTSMSFADADQALTKLQQQWAKAQYELENKAQDTAFLALIEQAEEQTSVYPE